ncbi:hypothetical protein GCM10022268_19510 [Sphingomonas cynarae]|uniref:Uncharacterized protein n=1 Tax=Sphingomonas cynarae TaxID=930197 RepID=A0ABP7DVL3_9SPHN
MKSPVLNHLNADDQSRVVQALEATLDALPDLSLSCAGWGDRGRNFMEFRHPRAGGPSKDEVHLTVDATQTMLRYRRVVDGRRVRTTIFEALDGIRRTRGETMEDAVARVRGWLEEAGHVTRSDRVEKYGSARRASSTALLAAACRLDDGWSSALAEMGSAGSPPCVMLGYPDDRKLARYCIVGEAPCDGRLSDELASVLRSGTPRRHVVSMRTVSDPAPMFRFGPPPIIRIRSDDVTPVARLTAIADAFDRGYELIPNEGEGIGGV